MLYYKSKQNIFNAMITNSIKIQICNLLNISILDLTKVEMWSNCIFTVVKGIGARFVSKKAVKVMTKKDLTIYVAGSYLADRVDGTFWDKIPGEVRIYLDKNKYVRIRENFKVAAIGIYDDDTLQIIKEFNDNYNVIVNPDSVDLTKISNIQLTQLSGSHSQIRWANRIRHKNISLALKTLDVLKTFNNDGFKTASYAFDDYHDMHLCLKLAHTGRENKHNYVAEKLIKLWGKFTNWLINHQSTQFWIKHTDSRLGYIFTEYCKLHIKCGVVK